MPFWRRESLHEKLAREGGLTPPPHDPGPHWGEVGIHGVARPREWDAVTTVDAPDVQGGMVVFVALPDGALLVEEGPEDVDPSPFAAAVENSLEAPYRAHAIRQSETAWAVGGRSLEVLELPEDVQGEEIELAATEGERRLRIDGESAFGSVPELERVAETRFSAYLVRARRLDGPWWEVTVDPL